MKKLLCLVLIALCLFAVTGCGGNGYEKVQSVEYKQADGINAFISSKYYINLVEFEEIQEDEFFGFEGISLPYFSNMVSNTQQIVYNIDANFDRIPDVTAGNLISFVIYDGRTIYCKATVDGVEYDYVKVKNISHNKISIKTNSGTVQITSDYIHVSNFD